MRARRRVPVLALVAGVTLSGCGSGGLYDVPLPGGADLGEQPDRVIVHFTDVLDLVPQSSVKVNDVAAGRVDNIGLARDGRTAVVTLLVADQVRLPENAEARLRQSSLLGEKFVELAEPVAEPPRGELADNAVIGVESTNRNTQIEEVLGALSALLNGGNVDQLNTIVTELNSAMSGNEAELRSLLAHVEHLTARLDGQRGDITRAIDSLDRLSGEFNAQRDKLDEGLRDLQPGLQVVNEQRDQLVAMLAQLDRLSGLAVDTVDRSKEDMLANLRALGPTLQKLQETGENLPRAMEFFVTYPFPPAAVNTLRGDYFNADLTIDLDLSTIVENMLTNQPPPGTPPPDDGAGEESEPNAESPGEPDLPLPLHGNPGDPAPPRPEPPERDAGGLLDPFGGS
ncbi:MCE family protein [Saccharopolyspora montiporae]|uniref:MCE family protein n=1 Tax=Saccharopolyspora montiporae TaxID=2781240 RepID=UPI001D152C27|nr:MCE family protein [Saccharopolyspora sp. HNM0983]